MTCSCCLCAVVADSYRNKLHALGTFESTYHLLGSMEGISPPDPGRGPGVYSSAKDDEGSMSNEEYLATLSQQQVRISHC